MCAQASLLLYVYVIIYILKLGIRGVMCVISKCLFCTSEIRTVDDLAKVGGSCSFGLIRRLQVREPVLFDP